MLTIAKSAPSATPSVDYNGDIKTPAFNTRKKIQELKEKPVETDTVFLTREELKGIREDVEREGQYKMIWTVKKRLSFLLEAYDYDECNSMEILHDVLMELGAIRSELDNHIA